MATVKPCSIFINQFFQVEDFLFKGTYKDLPSEYDIAPAHRNRIMHITLPIGNGSVLMGSDTFPGDGLMTTQGNNITLSYKADSKELADNIFQALSENGIVKMPMKNTFWGSYFGMVTDQFGIHWMIGFDSNHQE